MCGLCGVITSKQLYTREISIFKDLLNIGQKRGYDSTGVAMFDKNGGEVSLAKTIGVPYQLFNRYPGLLEMTEFLRGKTIKWLMGHNRKATRGLLTAQIHTPFHHGSIVGSHNGTLPIASEKILKDSFIKSVEGEMDGTTDSEMLFLAMSKGNSLKDLFKKKVAGDYALTWYDDVSEKFYIYRNSKRPLSFIVDKTSETLIYSSETPFLNMAIESSWMKHMTSFEPAKEFKEDVLYTVDFSGDKLKIDTEKIKSPQNEAVDWRDRAHYGQRNYDAPIQTAKKGGTISGAAEFYRRTKHRCSCGNPVYFSDYEEGILDYDEKAGIVYCNSAKCKRVKK